MIRSLDLVAASFLPTVLNLPERPTFQSCASLAPLDEFGNVLNSELRLGWAYQVVGGFWRRMAPNCCHLLTPRGVVQRRTLGRQIYHVLGVSPMARNSHLSRTYV
jgi:hypothetical protein